MIQMILMKQTSGFQWDKNLKNKQNKLNEDKNINRLLRVEGIYYSCKVERGKTSKA